MRRPLSRVIKCRRACSKTSSVVLARPAFRSASAVLIRTEASTLIGLMLKHEIDYILPTLPTLEKYVQTTETLLEEIHHAMSAPFWEGLGPAKIAEKNFNPFTAGAALREPIFYGGESAYSFQYRDFSSTKYASDDQWFVANKGFSIHDARGVVYSISRLQDEKAITALRSIRKSAPNTCLPPQPWGGWLKQSKPDPIRRPSTLASLS